MPGNRGGRSCSRRTAHADPEVCTSADGLHGLVQVPTVDEALTGADAAVLVTEWPHLAELDWAALAGRMRSAVLVDGRNMLEPEAMRAAGFTYDAIGRAAN